ncbi:MAG: GNAT family N-acetyltransferase, partial [Proteobacteria bacterium]|nr:GNAT family N-acetyltransferase [Pseudomonadota bacterium]
MSEILHEDDGLVIDVKPGWTPEYVALLNRTTWGTEGLRYLSHGIKDELTRLREFCTVEARKDGHLLGGYGLSTKMVRAGTHQIKTMHRMFLSVDPERGGKGLGTLLMKNTQRHFLDESNEPIMLYGYIEDDNSRSLKIAEKIGYRRIGTFNGTLFSRLTPTDHKEVDKVQDTDEITSLLGEQYEEYSLVDLDDSFKADEYWVLRQNGQIVAGVQALPRRWSIVDLPGVDGWLFVNFLPWLPLLGRVFDGQTFSHLLLSNIYARRGFEESFFDLLSALCARHSIVAAMAFTDVNCPVVSRLRKAGSFGLLDQIAPS